MIAYGSREMGKARSGSIHGLGWVDVLATVVGCVELCSMAVWYVGSNDCVQNSLSKHTTSTKPGMDQLQQINRAPSDVDKARLLAAASPHSGDWLHAPPITAVGLRLSDDAIRAAVARAKWNTLIEQIDTLIGMKFGVEKTTDFGQLLHARFHARSCSVTLDLPGDKPQHRLLDRTKYRRRK